MTVSSGAHRLGEAVPEAEWYYQKKENRKSAGQPLITLAHTHSYYGPLELGIGSCNFSISESETISKVGYFLGMIPEICFLSLLS